MEKVDPAGVEPDSISIAHCRELLGDEADGLSDQDVRLIWQRADALAHVLVEIFMGNRTAPE